MAQNGAANALFAFFDADGSKGLSCDELQEGMRCSGITFSDEDVKTFFIKYDEDKNGEIDFNEFLAFCMDLNTSESEKAVTDLFLAANAHGDSCKKSFKTGDVRAAISKFTGKSENDKEVQELIKNLDIDKDGDVSYEEFVKVILSKMGDSLKKKSAEANLFAFFDTDGNRGLSCDELKAGLASVGLMFSDVEVEKFFNKYDADHNGEIDFKEFLAFCMELNAHESQAEVANLFKAVDVDGDRSLTKAELLEGIATYTGKSIQDKEVQALLKQLDIDGDGEVSYKEFRENILVKIAVSMKKNENAHKPSAESRLFAFFDENVDDGLSAKELKEGMNSVGITFSDADVTKFFEKYDADKNGIIDFTEFLAFCMDLNTSDSEKAVTDLFLAAGAQGKKNNVKTSDVRVAIVAYTGKSANDKEVQDLIRQLDIDKDGEISYEEFTKVILGKLASNMKFSK